MIEIVTENPHAVATITQLFPIVHAFDDEQSPDELESTRIARSRFAGVFTEMRNVYTGGSYFGLGAGGGGDAA